MSGQISYMSSHTSTGSSRMSAEEYNRRVAKPLKPKSAAQKAADMSKPRSMPLSNGDLFGAVGDGAARKATAPKPEKKHPMEFLNRDSTADEDPPHPLIVSSSSKTSVGDHANGGHLKPIGTRSDSASPERVTFTTDVGPHFKGGHYIKVSNIEAGEAQRLTELLEEFDWDVKCRGKKVLAVADSTLVELLVCFDDTDEAAAAEGDINLVCSRWKYEYINHVEYAAAGTTLRDNTADRTSYYDGQVIFVATFCGPLGEIKPDEAKTIVREIAKSFGKILAFANSATKSSNFIEYRVEYTCITSARKTASELSSDTPHVTENWKIHVKEIPDPGAASKEATPAGAVSNDMLIHSSTGRSAWFYDANGRLQPDVTYKRPTSSAMTTTFKGNNTFGRNNVRHVQTQSYHQSPVGSNFPPRQMNSYGYNNHTRPLYDTDAQRVDINKVLDGSEIRTTIMIRNIPREWDCRQLKHRLDQFVAGQYDFSYLRMCFDKGYNMAYGFISFVSSNGLIDFWFGLVGQPWSPSNPRKVVEVAYATIQGIENLVEKFRNSAVLEENPLWRPKLWWVAGDVELPHPSMIGQEKPYPPPNNLARKQRSIMDASILGLFPPNSKPRGPDRPIHFHSAYDLGTPYQISEDAHHNNNYTYDRPSAGNSAQDPFIMQHDGSFYDPSTAGSPDRRRLTDSAYRAPVGELLQPVSYIPGSTKARHHDNTPQRGWSQFKRQRAPATPTVAFPPCFGMHAGGMHAGGMHAGGSDGPSTTVQNATPRTATFTPYDYYNPQTFSRGNGYTDFSPTVGTFNNMNNGSPSAAPMSNNQHGILGGDHRSTHYHTYLNNVHVARNPQRSPMNGGGAPGAFSNGTNTHYQQK